MFGRGLGAGVVGLGLMIGSAHAAETHTLTCDIGGIQAQMVATVEVRNRFGVVAGPGVNPLLLGVIPAGSYIASAGEIRSPRGVVRFSGEGKVADAVDLTTGARFRLRFELAEGGVYVIPNPFEGNYGYEGSGRYWCALVVPGHEGRSP